MPYYPTLAETGRSQETVDIFSGYNHNLKISDGQLYNMKNLSGDAYPLLSTRHKRGEVSTLLEPRGLLAKKKLAYIAGDQLIYDGENVTSRFTSIGLHISTDPTMLPKKLVSMGAYICVFPDKLYFNTENYRQSGSLEAGCAISPTSEDKVTYSICKADGTAYDIPSFGAEEPTDPADGALWLDSSEATHTLKQFSAATSQWVSVPTVYTRIAATGIGTKFNRLDGVVIKGCGIGALRDPATNTGYGYVDHFAGPNVFSGQPFGGKGVNADATAQVNTDFPQISELNGSKIIYDRGDDYIVVVGLQDKLMEQTGGTVSVERRVPDMDYITEAQNRLWGCKFGAVNGSTINEIYCCALGDPTNWNQFLGLSTDSYVASVGTDGPFTGAVTHMGYPIFFKENHLHKVYISSVGAHQISDTACRGVQQGSADSLQVVNGILYYKAQGDVCAYDGSLPVSVSAALGNQKFTDASAGALGDKYYISMKDSEEGWHMFVLDTLRGLWHREDDTQAKYFAALGGDLYYIDALNSKLMTVNAGAGTEENEISWEAETGIYGTNYAQRKYVGRLNLRLCLPEGSKADVYIQYDSDGVWRHSGHMDGVGTGSFTLPVRPRRCDHFRLKLSGTGELKLFSITKELERGSDQ